jgi:hypothetical protein
MASETRPICVYAMPNIKRNSTRLMIVMSIGIALALFGVYVQARNRSNPQYMPSVSLVSGWLYHNVGHLMSPSFFMDGASCNRAARQLPPSLRPSSRSFMQRFIYPVMRCSAILNGLINVAQILLLKIYCKSVCGTNIIIGLSAIGVVISAICLIGSFATCRLMCLSCLGIHHVVIMYLAAKRRRMLQSFICPTGPNSNPSSGGGCTFGTGGGGSGPTTSGNRRASGSSGNPTESSTIKRTSGLQERRGAGKMGGSLNRRTDSVSR